MAQTYNLTSNTSTGTLPIKGKLNVAAFGTFGGGAAISVEFQILLVDN